MVLVVQHASTLRPPDLSHKPELDSCAVTAEGDQLARVLGPGWEAMRYGQLADRAIALERAAGFARTLARYVVVTETDTAGEGRAEESRSHGTSVL